MIGNIDPENPSTVPDRYRPKMLAAAKRLGGDEICNLQMLTDLLALASNDGCIAAGWAFGILTKEPSEVIA